MVSFAASMIKALENGEWKEVYICCDCQNEVVVDVRFAPDYCSECGGPLGIPYHCYH